MPRYSLSELLERAAAGNIGRRGARRLQSAGYDADALASSGVAAPVDYSPERDLAARRAALYQRAVETARSGGTLSEGIRKRLELGAGSGRDAGTLTADAIRGLSEDNYQTVLDSLRKRRQGIQSQAGIYR